MKKPIDPAASALSAMACFSDGMSQLERAVDNLQMRTVVAGAADLIFAMKADSSYRVLEKVGMWHENWPRLSPLLARRPILFMRQEASHGDLGMIQNDDVVMLLSWSGEQANWPILSPMLRALPFPLLR
jgi:arabinose-5-phosphate isomerase